MNFLVDYPCRDARNCHKAVTATVYPELEPDEETGNEPATWQ